MMQKRMEMELVMNYLIDLVDEDEVDLNIFIDVGREILSDPKMDVADACDWLNSITEYMAKRADAA